MQGIGSKNCALPSCSNPFVACRQLAAQASGSQRDVAHLIREEAPGCWPPADLPVLLSGRKAGSTCAESELSTSSHHDVDMQSPTAAAEGVPPRPPLRSDPSTADSWQVLSLLWRFGSAAPLVPPCSSPQQPYGPDWLFCPVTRQANAASRAAPCHHPYGVRPGGRVGTGPLHLPWKPASTFPGAHRRSCFQQSSWCGTHRLLAATRTSSHSISSCSRTRL